MQDHIEKPDLPPDVTFDVTDSETKAMKHYMFAKTVDHPDHYNNNPSGVECIDVIEHMSLNVGNAVKYLWRLGYKGNTVEQLEKAIWYCEREKQRLLERDRKIALTKAQALESQLIRNHFTGKME